MYDAKEFQHMDVSIKERYLKLVNRIATAEMLTLPDRDPLPVTQDDRRSDFETVIKYMNNAADYVAQVYLNELTIPTIHFRYEGNEIAEKIMELDRRRNQKHEALISGLSSLNRICDGYQSERIYQGDLKNRYQVADFAEAAMHCFFATRDIVTKLDKDVLKEHGVSLDKKPQTVQKSVDEWLSEANEILTSHFEKEREVEGKEEMERE